MHAYNLCLANGQNWQFMPTKGTADWLARLASIMRLEAAEPNGYPKLIFSREKKKAGWKLRDIRSVKFWSHYNSRDIFCAIGKEKGHELEIIRMWFSLLCVYNKAIEQGGLPFHSALVQSGGKGVLLAGKGNIGKSTCARRIALPWQAVCDDETLVVRDTAGSYKAHPFPTWSDYLYKRREPTWDVQQSFPLSAIFFLQQAESDEAIPLGGAKAAVCINESATQVCRRNWRGLTYKEEAAFKKKVFENACLLAKAVPVFILHFSLKGKFWKEIEKVL